MTPPSPWAENLRLTSRPARRQSIQPIVPFSRPRTTWSALAGLTASAVMGLVSAGESECDSAGALDGERKSYRRRIESCPPVTMDAAVGDESLGEPKRMTEIGRRVGSTLMSESAGGEHRQRGQRRAEGG